MADVLRRALTNSLRKAEMAGDVDFLRDGVRILGQTLMDLEVSRHLRAEKNERTPERAGHRNGYRTRRWDTKSQASRLCEELDAEVERFRTRRLREDYPCVWRDATFLKVRQEGGCCVDGGGDRHRRDRNRRGRGSGTGRGPLRERGILAPVPSRTSVPMLEGGSPGDQ